MRIVVTGGGTGGHVFPALETAEGAAAKGWEVRYLGSHRGQEGPACEKAGIEFEGYASEPLVRPASLRGLKAMLQMLRSSSAAKRSLALFRPSVIFSTGGYSSAPIVHAARRLGIPLVMHEQNAVPGRTNRLMARHATTICTVFRSVDRFLPAGKVVRTGMPIRARLRSSAQGTLPLGQDWVNPAPTILVMGGSQGSAALNDVALATAARMARSEVQWIHITGPKHFEAAMLSRQRLAIRAEHDLKAFLDVEQMAVAVFNSSLAVCRSGAGSLAELAAFRRPSILVPYPYAHGQHQLHNAEEFAEMGAAELLEQKDLDASGLEGRILGWLHDPDRVRRAQEALAEWDIVESVPRILDVLQEAGSRK